MLKTEGMPQFQELTIADAEALRAYIRLRAEQDLKSNSVPKGQKSVGN